MKNRFLEKKKVEHNENSEENQEELPELTGFAYESDLRNFLSKNLEYY